MTLNQIKCFLTLSQLLNFTRAAEVLNITQPTLSKMLTGIEDEIGVPLLHRTKRSVCLTEAGKNICPYFEQMLSTYKSGVDSTIATSNGMSGIIHIGFSSIIVNDILPHLIRRMEKLFPDIIINLYDGTQEELVHLLSTDELDMAILDSNALYRNMNFQNKPLFSDPIYVFFSNEHPFISKSFVTLEDLANENILVSGRLLSSSSSPTTTNFVCSDILTNAGLLHQVKHVTRTIGNMLIMTDCNYGVSLLPHKFVNSVSSTVTAVPLLKNANDENSTLNININFVWKENALQEPCIKCVLSTMDAILLELQEL